ncbi:MAG TPA: signal peptidase II [Ignavibacteriaceae bacterium]|nr:signal peptidase II [Ignavibacteriaceae bacterium]
MKVLYITFAAVLTDVITKLLVKGIQLPFEGIRLSGMPYGSSIPLLGDFLKLTFVENPGMAFGIRVSNKEYLALFTIIATLGLLFYLYKIRKESFWLRMPMSLILAGAIGNLTNRVFFGALFGYAPLLQGNVVDFIDVDFFDLQIFGYYLNRWPIFNLADVFVTVGVVLLLAFGKLTAAKDSDEMITQNTNVVKDSNE